MKIETTIQTRFKNITFTTQTPDGDMFVSVMESDAGKAVAVQINIGKAGTNINAWAHSCARLCTVVLDNGGSINDLIDELSSMRTDKSRLLGNGVEIKSGPEGLCYLLMRYISEKSKENKKSYGGLDYARPTMDRR